MNDAERPVSDDDDDDVESDRIPFNFHIRDKATGKIRLMTLAEFDAVYGVPDRVPGSICETCFAAGIVKDAPESEDQ